jgi:hypothetical protein
MDSKGWHHAYGAILLMLAGFLGILFTDISLRLCGIAIGIGLVVFLEDVFQHAIQRTRPEYRSWLNRTYGKTIYKWHWIQKLNEWFDKLFGRK